MSGLDCNPDKPLVLVVDDEAFMRRTLCDALTLSGFDVREAPDGHSAIDFLREERADIVLLDVVMPGLDGFDTCIELRRLRNGKHTPIIMTTALEDTEWICRGYEAGATGEDVETLLKNADTAMYHAKEKGRNTFRFFSASMNEAAQHILGMEKKLRLALQQEDFQIHYQPQIDLASGRVVGLEALLRWQLDGKMVPPAEFIPLAEAIGDMVLRQACSRSNRQFWQHKLPVTIASILRESGLDPSCLQLEITENFLMENDDLTISSLRALKAMGVGLILDDFGTGFSSLSYLKHFPLDYLKIDASFIRNVAEGNEEGAIVAAMIAMARSPKLRVIAQGVETDYQE